MISGLGEKIKNKRKELGLSQKDLAKALGISQGYVSDIEAGRKTPGGDVLISLSKYFGSSLVIGEEGSPPTHPTAPTLIVVPSYTGPDRRTSEPISVVAEDPFCFTKGPPKLTQFENRLLVAFRGLNDQQREDKLFEIETLATRNESRRKEGGGSNSAGKNSG